MKFTEVKEKHSFGKIRGKKDNFYFFVEMYNRNCFYVSVYHKTNDIRFNTLNEGITFESHDEAKKWCESFNRKEHNCLGKDA